MTPMRVGLPRPRPRGRELLLLVAMAATLATGWVSLQTTTAGRVGAGDPTVLLVYLALLFAIHVVFVIAGRSMDQVLLPVVGMLGGLSLLLMARLPQDLVTQSFGGRELSLAPLQLVWIGLALVLLTLVALFVRSDGWLRYYKYTWAAVGIALLLAVFLFGTEVGGQRLSLRIGPVQGQPSELLKIILVVFLASYLADNRALLALQSTNVGPFRLPPVPYLLPMLAMWGLALAIVVVQRDLGAALLFFSVFLALLYSATLRVSYVVLGALLFVAGGALLYGPLSPLFGTVRDRVDIWLDPFADPQGAGFQIIRALYAFGRGGVLGTGLGGGLPQVGTQPAIPAIHTDFVFTALSEELGLLGGLAILCLYLVIAQRGLRIAATAADDFRSLLAAGLTLVVVIQAAIIVGGNAKLVPLTGITLPFISYGGSSLLANAIIVGLLLALSDRGREQVALIARRTRRERLQEGVEGVRGKVEQVLS
jgi:cell division protein FtsW (lipid II flippase)